MERGRDEPGGEGRGTAGVPAGRASAPLRGRIGRWAGAALAGALLVLPPPDGLEPAAWRTAAVGLLMAVWWMTEALPIPATALLPLVCFPLLGIAPMADAAAPYAHPLIFLFLGGFLIALALQRWGLHRRIALGVLHRLGARPVRLVAGFMVASALLSMWISNTATAMLMLPIGLSLVELVEGRSRETGEGHRGGGDLPGGHFALCLMLGIAYACSLGGVATLIGTPTNALLAAFLADSYGFELGFADWMLLGLPLVIVGLPLMLVVLTRGVYPIRVREVPGGAEFIRRELERLGPVGPAERRVALVFGATALAWVTRPLLEGWLPGLSDPGIAMAGGLALFLLPSGAGRGGTAAGVGRRGTAERDSSGPAGDAGGEGATGGSAEALLDWATARRLPWGVLLLFGGGLSLAAAIRSTGLASWIGDAMRGLGSLPAPVVVLLATMVILLLTELTSNTATAAAFLPVLASMASGLGIAPLRLLVPAALAASCAFMLPVATPPNAIVFGSGRVTVPAMARAGVWMNLLFLGLVVGLSWWLVPRVLGELP